MIGNAAFANDQDSTWFWSPIENFGYILTSKSYVGYAIVQSISINRASLYALYCGTFHAAQDNIIIVTMQSKIPMRLTAKNAVAAFFQLYKIALANAHE